MLDFPNAPTTGQRYPQPAIAGVPVYTWDGEKWTTVPGSIGGKTAVLSDGSVPMAAQLTVLNPPVNPTDAVAKAYVDAASTLSYSGIQINGTMEINQALPGTGTAANNYIVDGCMMFRNGAMVVWAQQSSGNFSSVGFPYHFAIAVTTPQAAMTANDLVQALGYIEGRRISRLGWGTVNAQPLTIGFWTAHHRTGIYTGSVRNGAAPYRSYAFSYTQTAADVPQFNIVTIPGDTTGTWATDHTLGMMVSFTMACGTVYTAPSANAWLAGNYIAAPGQVNAVAATTDAFRLTGVAILPGYVPLTASRSPFIMRPFEQELIACQRYYEKTYDLNVLPGTAFGSANSGAVGCYIYSASNFPVIMWSFKVQKRPGLNCSFYSPFTGAIGYMRSQNDNRDVVAGAQALGQNAAMICTDGQFSVQAGNFCTVHGVADARF